MDKRNRENECQKILFRKVENQIHKYDLEIEWLKKRLNTLVAMKSEMERRVEALTEGLEIKQRPGDNEED